MAPGNKGLVGHHRENTVVCESCKAIMEKEDAASVIKCKNSNSKLSTGHLTPEQQYKLSSPA